MTEQLVERLPAGRVIAVDASPAMVRAARERLGDRAEVRLADLAELELDEPVDAVLSTATFHWVADHDALFTRLRRALRPGGRLVAQCGGAGNVADVRAAAAEVAAREPYAPTLRGFDPWTFAGAEETERRLRAAGFARARAWLEPRDVETGGAPLEYLRTVMLGAHLERLPSPLREPFAEEVLARIAPFEVARYVRLNIHAELPDRAR